MNTDADNAPAVEELSFEGAFEELEGTVQRLENGELTLAEAISLYERGMALGRRCSNSLDAAELQVQQLAVANDQQQLGMFFSGEAE